MILKEIKKEKGKFAFVGVSCQIHGLRKVMIIDESLRDKIVFCLGLFCKGTLNFHFQDRILTMLKVDKKDVKEFSYKDKEWKNRWPGDLRIKLSNGEIKNLDGYHRMVAKPFFTPWRCNLCYDKLNELSDIAFGDAWLQEVRLFRK